MFLLIDRIEKENGFKDRLFDLTHKAQIGAERITLSPGKFFFKICAADRFGRVAWKEIEKLSRGLSKRVVLPEGTDLPENSPFKKFFPFVFSFRTLFYSALGVISKLKLDPCSVFVSVFDENGYATDLIERLVPFCGKLAVITGCPDAYGTVAKLLFEKYGVSLIIRTVFDPCVLSSTAIICENAEDVPIYYKGILFTNHKRRSLEGTVMSGKEVCLPPEFEQLCPKKTDRLLFAGALYELCAANGLDGLEFCDFG